MPKPMTARAQEAVSKLGLRATFALPYRNFWVVVTLQDGSVHSVDQEGRRESRIVVPLKITPKAWVDTVARARHGVSIRESSLASVPGRRRAISAGTLPDAVALRRRLLA
jgi:hypothetical protein